MRLFPIPCVCSLRGLALYILAALTALTAYAPRGRAQTATPETLVGVIKGLMELPSPMRRSR
ncbi:MAG: hypothetical protein ABJE47_24190 [bacterium]